MTKNTRTLPFTMPPSVVAQVTAPYHDDDDSVAELMA